MTRADCRGTNNEKKLVCKRTKISTTSSTNLLYSILHVQKGYTSLGPEKNSDRACPSQRSLALTVMSPNRSSTFNTVKLDIKVVLIFLNTLKLVLVYGARDSGAH